MILYCIGLNHKTSPVEIREKFAIPKEIFINYILELKEKGKIGGGVWLQTCNRSEFYFTMDFEEFLDIIEELKALSKIDFQEKEYFYILKDFSAIEHLFFVSSSLDSMVIGEPQILGQVKESFEFSLKNGGTNLFLNELFQASIRVGKKVRNETKIGEGAVSVPFVAVELAKKIYGELKNLCVLFIGAGEIAELSLLHLKENGVQKIFVLNRTKEKAIELANKYRGEGYGLESLSEFLDKSDLIITCASAYEPIIKEKEIYDSLKKRKFKSQVIIDLGVPQNVDTNLRKIEGIFLYNIDDLKEIAEQNKKEREKSIIEAERIIDEELKKFKDRWETLKLFPFIKEIKEHINKIKYEEMEKFFKKTNNFSFEQKKQIEIFVDGLLQKILHPLLEEIKIKKPKAGAQNLIRRFLGLKK